MSSKRRSSTGFRFPPYTPEVCRLAGYWLRDLVAEAGCSVLHASRIVRGKVPAPEPFLDAWHRLLIAAGVHPKAIQARLGHASITTTLNTYGHLMPSAFQGIGDRLDALITDMKNDRERDGPVGAMTN